MQQDRRNFLKRTAMAAGVVAAAGGAAPRTARASGADAADAVDAAACLVDTTLCIGCRKCEEACNEANRLPRPDQPFDDRWVFRDRRRPGADSLTVVNAYGGHPSNDQPDRSRTFVKVQCMHCLDPACVSACIVGALTKSPQGPVHYDADKCIGCRYCMVACPFEIPAYEYDEAVLPKVRKCSFCMDDLDARPEPACAAACPVEAIVFGKRGEILELARERIHERPDRYVDHVYGEHEVGGTSWLYLTGRPPEEIDLLPLPEKSPPRLTESIQHGIFRYGALPILAFSGLGALMWWTNRRQGVEEKGAVRENGETEESEEQTGVSDGEVN